MGRERRFPGAGNGTGLSEDGGPAFRFRILFVSERIPDLPEQTIFRREPAPRGPGGKPVQIQAFWDLFFGFFTFKKQLFSCFLVEMASNSQIIFTLAPS